MIFHVINRGNAQDRIFDDDAEYAAFEMVLHPQGSDATVGTPDQTRWKRRRALLLRGLRSNGIRRLPAYPDSHKRIHSPKGTSVNSQGA
jgi:hypothetical protein